MLLKVHLKSLLIPEPHDLSFLCVLTLAPLAIFGAEARDRESDAGQDDRDQEIVKAHGHVLVIRKLPRLKIFVGGAGERTGSTVSRPPPAERIGRSVEAERFARHAQSFLQSAGAPSVRDEHCRRTGCRRPGSAVRYCRSCRRMPDWRPPLESREDVGHDRPVRVWREPRSRRPGLPLVRFPPHRSSRASSSS